jgi:uncharacterized repeat protein (TIGR01451 family)
MNLHKVRRGTAVFGLMTAMVAVVLTSPSVASAESPPSSVEVSSTTLEQGQTFTVTEQLFNPEDFTISHSKAAIYGLEVPIVQVADLVSCTGTVAPCSQLGSSYRAPVGDIGPGESRTAVFTLRVKDDAPLGQLTLRHQHVGDNFSFETLDGPVIMVTAMAADLAVALEASSYGLLISTVTYTITASNLGPAEATGIRLTATYAAGLRFLSSPACVRVPHTRTVNCDIASLAAGATVSVTFTTVAELLALGPFSTQAERAQSTPGDPDSTNDSATVTCTALTGLLVSC